ncbi:hypothetical protein HCX48_13540 [Rhodocyclus tenuis]|uniref:DNA-binding protein n=2 Tax=Rhodocyclus gracilis TaxID=2929842 RepID=A0ABX0WKI7_9RHOO|nr:hypothetical protein [Rhodocyclus gracilis]
MKFRVLGAKGFKGMVEGQHFDSTRLYVEMPVSEKNGTEVGFNAVALPFGKEEEYQKLKHLEFPLHAELTLEATTKGFEVRGFKALGLAPAASK